MNALVPRLRRLDVPCALGGMKARGAVLVVDVRPGDGDASGGDGSKARAG